MKPTVTSTRIAAVAAPLLAAAIFGLIGTWAGATDFFWTGPGSGDISQTTKWNPQGTPGASDTINFDLGVAPANRYGFSVLSRDLLRAIVHNDSLQISLQQVNLTSQVAGESSLVVGASSGDEADLVLRGILSDPTLTTFRTTIAAESGSTGTVTLINSLTWDSTSNLNIGFAGSGSLLIQDGSQLNTFALTQMGVDSGSVGNLTVSGAGSEMRTNSAAMGIGQSGEGTLLIEAGGLVHVNGAAGLAVFDDGVGTATVTGSDSVWSTTSTQTVGVQGQGTLNILAGGRVTAPAGVVGDLAPSQGLAEVGGFGSVWEAGDLRIGNRGGTGILHVRNGGRVESNFGGVGAITTGVGGDSSQGSGNVTVDSQGEWEISGTLRIGGPRSGTVVAAASGLVSVGTTVLLRDQGLFHLDGGELRTPDISREGGEFLWTSGSLRLTGAQGLTVGASGLLGPTIFLNASQFLRVDEELRIENGATLLADGGLVTGTLAAGTAVVEAGGQMVFTSNDNVRPDFDVLTNHGDIIVTRTGRFTGAVTNAAGGTITAVETLRFLGPVDGPGGFFGPGTVEFEGGYSPGSSPGQVLFEGNLSFGTFNDLNIELGGLTPGTEFDQLVVEGDLALDGELNVSLLDGMTLGLNQQFLIVDAQGTVGGQFDGLAEGGLVGTFDGQDLFITYAGGDGNDVALLTQTAALAGDYNNDGVVNAADYALWRNSVGAPAGTLPNDTAGGAVGSAQYGLWMENFGSTSAADTFSSGAVPEPGSLALCSALLAAAAWKRRKGMN